MPSAPQYTLGIETATQNASLCLLRGADVIAEWAGDNTIPVSAELLPRIAKLLADSSVRTSEITLIAACAGPGSFTGVRIGLATAKALQFAHGTPAIAVSLTEAMAASVDLSKERVACLIPAGRADTYIQQFQAIEGKWLSGSPVNIYPNLQIPGLISAGTECLTTSDLKPEAAAVFTGGGITSLSVIGKGMAAAVAQIAIERFLSGEADGSEDLIPIYARAAVVSGNR